jgi:CheY-like chemotaxis protein
MLDKHSVESQQHSPPDQRPTALIVEDDPDCAHLWTRYLGNTWRPLLTSRGEEALGLARLKRPDLILLDINLPGMSGWDVLAILRADPGTREIPVIICSGVYEPTRGRAMGAQGYLLKPVRFETFRRTVQSAVGV